MAQEKFWEQDALVGQPAEVPAETPPLRRIVEPDPKSQQPQPIAGHPGWFMDAEGNAFQPEGLPSPGKSGGKPLPAWAAKPYEEQIGIYAALTNSAGSFQDDFGGNTVTGGLENWLQGKIGVGTPGQRDWWAQFKQNDNIIRNKLFGATLTPSEQQAYAATSIEPGMVSSEIRKNLATRRDIVRKALARKSDFLRAQGYSSEAIDALAGEYAPDFGSPEAAQEKPQDQQQPGDIGFAGLPAPPENPLNPVQQAAYDAWHQANPNATADQLRAFGASIGVDINNAEAIIEARDKGAGVQGGAEAVPGLTPEEQAQVDARLDKGGGTVAAVMGAADTVTLGTVDKLSAAADAVVESLAGQGSFGQNFERNLLVENAFHEALSDDHPWLYHGGQIAAGLALPTFGARTPAQLSKIAAAYGAAYGAGSSDGLTDVPGNVVTGAGLGAATGWLGGKLVEKLERRAARTAAEVAPDAAEDGFETAADRYARGQRFGLDLSIGDVRGRGAKMVERSLDAQAAAADVMNTPRQKLAGQVDEAVETVASGFGPSTSFRGIGEAAQRGSKKWIEKFERVSGKAYEAIPISPKTMASLDNTRQALAELTTIFESNPKMAEAFANSRLNRYLAALDPNDSGNLSWADLKSFRTRIGEEIGEQRFSDSPTKTELRRLYAALSEDMKLTAQARGPQALRAFERANNIYRAGQQRIENALKDILGDDAMKSVESSAAKVQALVREGRSSADLGMVHEIWKSLPAAERGEVANGLIRLMGQPANSEGRAFNAQTFFRTFADISPSAKNLIFGAGHRELRQNLDEFVKVIGDVAASDSTRNVSGSAYGLGSLMTTGVGVTLGSAGGTAGAILGILASNLGVHTTARLWTSPKFVRWATGYAKMVNGAAKAGKVKPASVATQVKLLDKLAASEPALAQDVIPLRQAILSAVNDNFGSQAAASDEKAE